MIGNGLRGLTGQSLAGRRLRYPKLAQVICQSSANMAGVANTGSFTAPEDLVADIFAWGGGASGGGADGYGGGAGAAGYSRLVIPRGRTVSWSVGNAGYSNQGGGVAGGDTFIQVDGLTLTAGGGRPSGGAPAPRAYASSFQVNRYGGGSGEMGQFGAALIYSGQQFGGTSGGFSDMFGPNTGGQHGVYSGGGAPTVAGHGAGGRGEGGGYSGYGGSGLVLIHFQRMPD